MLEIIKNNIKNHKNEFVKWLTENDIEFIVEAVEWCTVGNENDFYEVDIWPEDYGFFQVYFDQNGNLTHYEVEEDE